MTALQKTLVAASLAVALGTGLYQASQAASLRRQVQTLQQQQVPLAEEMAQLRADNGRLSNLLAAAKESPALSQAQLNELLRLRGQSAQMQSNARELARLKASVGQPSGQIPDYLTNAMAIGMRNGMKYREQHAWERLARMEQTLNLSPEQSLAISNLMSAGMQRETQQALDLLAGHLSPEQQQAALASRGDLEAAIKGLLTPEQLAAYPGFLEQEKAVAATAAAQKESAQVAADFGLPQAQREKLREALYQMQLNQPSGPAGNPAGGLNDKLQANVELQKSQLEQKLKILESFLSPEQLASYRQEQLNRIDMLAGVAKMVAPATARQGQ